MTNETDEYRRWLRERRYADRTVTAYLHYTRRADRYLTEQARRIRYATTDDLTGWMRTLPASGASRNQARKALAAYYRFRDRTPNPAEAIEAIPVPDGLPRPLSPEGHAAFLQAGRHLGGEHQTVSWMFALTGCRFSELRRARWSQFTGATWRVEGKGSARKGPKLRDVPVHPALVPVLDAHRFDVRSPDWLFPSTVGYHPYRSESYLRRIFSEVAQHAGLPGTVPHQLRHTTATRILDLTGNLRVVQEFLGHASIRTTQVYTQVDLSRIRDAVERFAIPDDDGPIAA